MSASILPLTDTAESLNCSLTEKTNPEGPSRPGFQRVLTLLIVAMVYMLAGSLFLGFASPAQAASQSTGELSADVTDPQNLLGGSVSKVNDEIASTKQETGVTVRLLYLANFTGTKDPDKWAGESLQSTKPPANTVLLAVASNDGRLVVAVSHNSDNWLKDNDHVSQLSQAALGPIQKGDNPDWSGSACAMMDEIKVLHKQEASKKPKIIIGVSVGVVVVLIAVGVVVMLRKRKAAGHKHAKSAKGKSEGEERGEDKREAAVENSVTEQTDASSAAEHAKPKTKGPRHRKKK
ncbi:TPM domain-containing protein [Bifidobacterium sp. ESL0690]|uniref:TPM domain-containing protein n=1 Tax=Bifidobacterium sp. ESL0690 TaxID=2983214 RepID=UPI0023F7ECE3|nr:TPM domain-containing protein [Bifidobacterium sp. ESL0690]WEV46010.1 TPM domain-containing protein [Bifidobacterium sp. ESL0690]